MIDFLIISERSTAKGTTEIYPKFRMYPKSSDLMVRGGDFYAIWVEELGIWSTDEDQALMIIDRELHNYVDQNKDRLGDTYRVLYMQDSDSGMVDAWHKYCQKQCRDNFCPLDETLIFSNMQTKREDYASKRLPYPLEEGSIEAYDKLISTLYSEEERHKIEWAIGAIVTGDSKRLQKFMVLYGSAGTGKSTIINIIQKLFDGYYSVFDAKALGSSNNAFALEAFKTNPLVALQHDGDLSKLEDNTRLNSLVSHEFMTVNEKFKSAYTNRFLAFLIMGTNKPVRITDGKSGLIRRLIDVTPSGNKLPAKEYNRIVKQVDFELGAIAYHCKEVYLSNPHAYDNYIPSAMMGATNDFYNFILDAYYVFRNDDGTTLKAAWEMYKNYCEEAKVPYPYSMRPFKEELKNYFKEFYERYTTEDGTRIRNYYRGFIADQFEAEVVEPLKKEEEKPKLIDFKEQHSILDDICASYPAQYASESGIPTSPWAEVTTKLSDLDTSKLHYLMVPEKHIVIDFDLKDENGNKSLELNIAAASKWPATYGELSKSGCGVHLHYIYTGDPSQLSRIYDDNIEVKAFRGNSSLRRKLTKCNNLPIATISSGLPLKEVDKMINFEGVKNEKMLRAMIKRNLNKEYHSATKPSIDFINTLLEEAYASGMGYDVTDLRNSVFAFAAGSTNQADYCIKLVNKMKFRSEEASAAVAHPDGDLVFYDVEVFPNLLLVNWKYAGEGQKVVRMINPSPAEIEQLLHMRLVGFNCRRYDNHMLYARLIGYTNEQLFDLSQKIVNSKKGENREFFFREAYSISYTDVYDFASAGNKKSLKKFEIELGIHHQELGLPWDKPVPEEMWPKVAEYCDNDVIATEKVFYHLKADWTARQILADLAGMTVNDTTNTLTAKIIFGNDRRPQSKFNYRDLSEPVYHLDDDVRKFLEDACPEMMAAPHGEAKSLLPYFEGYEFKYGKSTYRGEDVSEGGHIYFEPGIHENVALLDIASMHPHSTIAEVLFGVEFTTRFREIVVGRVHIKHEAWEAASNMLDGKLAPYIQKVINGEMTCKDLADALKTAINAVYGQTYARYECIFKDPRNVDNIVAKRGALFMVDLKYAVQERGFTVAHIKTDSIKIPNATPEIIQFVMDFGKRYGYTFEHEATYSKMCLVNKAVYIAKYKDGKHAGEWTATGTQFAVPYVFKKLFSKEPIEFSDLCETKEVKSSIYLDMDEDLPEGEHNRYFVGRVGSFCPIKPGCGGGTLCKDVEDNEGNIKYDAVTGTKGYRWLEAEAVLADEKKQECIDLSYYNSLVDDAIDAISEYGDFEIFVSDEPMKKETLPPCGDRKYATCFDCPNFHNDEHHMDCRLGYDVTECVEEPIKQII